MNSLLSTATLYNDWVVLLLIVSFVLVSLTFGADIPQIRKSLRSMFSFKNPDGLLVYAPLSLFGLFLAALHVAVSTGVLIYLYKGSGVSGYSETVIESVLSLSVLMAIFLVAKIILYVIVNGYICRKYYISSQHFRWISFYLMVQSINGTVALVSSLLVLFLNVPVWVAVVLFLFFSIILEIGTLFKLFTAFFKKKCSILVFFIYLCALEIAPCILVWFLVK